MNNLEVFCMVSLRTVTFMRSVSMNALPTMGCRIHLLVNDGHIEFVVKEVSWFEAMDSTAFAFGWRVVLECAGLDYRPDSEQNRIFTALSNDPKWEHH